MNTIRAALAAGLIALALTGCAQLQSIENAIGIAQNATVTPAMLDKVQQTAKTGIDAYNGYRYIDAAHTVTRPYCKAGEAIWNGTSFCAQYGILRTGQTVIRNFDTAFAKVQAEVAACVAAGQTGCSGIAADWQILTDAAGALSGLIPSITAAEVPGTASTGA